MFLHIGGVRGMRHIISEVRLIAIRSVIFVSSPIGTVVLIVVPCVVSNHVREDLGVSFHSEVLALLATLS